MYVDRSEVSLINSEISDCRAPNGGAVYVWDGKARVEGSTFTSCFADQVGHVERPGPLAQR